MSKLTRRAFMGVSATAAALGLGQVGRHNKVVAQSMRRTSARQRTFYPKSSVKQTGDLNLYSSRHYDTDNALYQGFSDQSGLRLNLIEADSDALIERMKSEGANRSS